MSEEVKLSFFEKCMTVPLIGVLFLFDCLIRLNNWNNSSDK